MCFEFMELTDPPLCETIWCSGCSFLFRRVSMYKETKSMSEYQEPIQVTSAATPRWVGIALVTLAAVSLLGIGIGWSALNHANSVEQTTQTSVRQANDALAQKLAKEDEINQQLQSDLKVVTDKLNVTQSDLVKARKQNRQSSVAVDKKIAGLESSVNTQLAAKANADDVTNLNTDVTHAALELVVNKVTKSSASGYLSVPKAAGSTSASASTSGQ